MFTEEQEKYIREHLRRPENDAGIAKIAYVISKEFKKAGGEIQPDIAMQTAVLMNLGETDTSIAHIYLPTCNWKQYPEAIELNKLHGAISVKMAESIGIALSDEQKAVIEGHSKGEYSSTLAQIIKIAEVCKATESERWYRGEKKAPAKSWTEVHDVLIEDKNLNVGLISLAANSYGKEHFEQLKKEQEHDDIS